MMQEILIGLIFIAASVYLFRIFRNHFSLKNGSCPKGCGCAGIDFDKLEKKIKRIDNG